MTNFFFFKSALYEPPETAKPRDITIGAACKSAVKLTPIDGFRHLQFANS
jgi:hypothetical protein